MTTKQDLARYLKAILKEKSKLTGSPYQDLLYWQTDDNENFYVQEYVPSKKIIVNEKEYDPTMRVAFFLNHDQGVITVHVVAGYWKIPSKGLNEVGTLTEKHITRPSSGKLFTGIPVRSQDFKQVKELLVQVLPALYTKMLEHEH